MKNGRKKWIVLFTAGLLGIIAAFIVTCSFGIVKVQGDSMEPAIGKGNLAVVSKLSYFFRQPRAGDVVAFPCNVYGEDGEGSTLIRRVVATEGDLVEIRDGMLYVNGKVYDKYVKDPAYMEPMEKKTVGAGRVFVLSDNRGAMLDSRDDAVGQLEIAELSGKVCFK